MTTYKEQKHLRYAAGRRFREPEEVLRAGAVWLVRHFDAANKLQIMYFQGRGIGLHSHNGFQSLDTTPFAGMHGMLRRYEREAVWFESDRPFNAGYLVVRRRK
jgi:hypothetical protein